MRQFLVLALISLSAAACRPDNTEPPPSVAKQDESRATEMPESLRCTKAADCTVQTSCYWDTPTCVAAAGMVKPECGSDADPHEAARDVTCGCSQGQCVVN